MCPSGFQTVGGRISDRFREDFRRRATAFKGGLKSCHKRSEILTVRISDRFWQDFSGVTLAGFQWGHPSRISVGPSEVTS